MGPAMTLKMLFYAVLLCTLSRIQCDETLTNKGGFVFEELATNHLNQEFMTFSRQLNFSLLQPLVDNLQGLLSLHGEICDRTSAQLQVNATVISNHGTKIEHHGFVSEIMYTLNPNTSIFSPSIGMQNYSDSVCKDNSARLPEPNDVNLRSIRTACINHKVYKIPVGFYYNSISGNLHYFSTNEPVSHELFKDFSFFNNFGKDKIFTFPVHSDSTKKEIQGSQVYLVDCQSSNPRIQFVHRTMGLSLPLICEKSNSFLTDIDSNAAGSFLYQWIFHSCKRDHPALEKQVRHAESELQQILDYQFEATKLLKFADYYPMFADGLSSPKSVSSSDIDVTIVEAPPAFLEMQPAGREPKNSRPRSPRHVSVSVPILQPNDTLLRNITKNCTFPELLSALHLTNETLRNMVYVYTDSDNPDESQIEDFLLHNPLDKHSNSTVALVRDKRGIRLVVAAIGIFIIGIISFVRYIKSLFQFDLDLLTLSSPPAAALLQLHQTNGHVKDLTIQQNDIKAIVNRGSEIMSQIKKELQGHIVAVTLASAQLDAKTSIQYALHVVDSFVAKLANILLGAQSGTTSIYALNKFDLQAISTAVTKAYPGIALTSKLNEVRTDLVSFESNLKLLFTIPIVSKSTLFRFFKVIPIPIFQGNTTLLPDSSFTNLAIDTTDTFYTTLSDQEFNLCLSPPNKCRTHFPMKFVSNKYDCVMAAYLDHNATCPYKPIADTPYPFFYFNGVKAVYSVPEPTNIRITCYGNKGMREQNTFQISQVGNLVFPPNCKIVPVQSQYEFHFNTPRVSEVQGINYWNTFDNIQLHDIPDKTIISLYQDLEIRHLAPTNITVPLWEDLLRESVNLKKVLPTWLQIIILGLIGLALFFLGRYLNSIVCCDAVKGASYRRANGMFSGFGRWMNKRADYFRTLKTQPQHHSSIDPSTNHSRRIQEHPRAYYTQVNNDIVFADDPEERNRRIQNMILASQAENARITSQGLLNSAKSATVPDDHVYVSLDEINMPNRNIYANPRSASETLPTHNYNTRSNKQKQVPLEQPYEEPTAPHYHPVRPTGFQL